MASRKLKIVHTAARYYPYIGGTEQVVRATCKGLVHRGHDVSIICADEPKGAPDIVDGIRINRLPYIAKIANTNITPSLANALFKEKFDVLHTHLPHPWTADVSGIVSLARKKPLFLTYHNDISGGGGHSIIARIYNITALRLLLKISKKVFVTNMTYVERSKHLWPYRHKLVYAPLGVDFDRFFPKEGIEKVPKSIFFLSILDEFHRYKGLDYLLDACAMIMAKDKEVILYVGGGGCLLESYRRKAEALNIQGNVLFLGHLSDDDVSEYYNSCSLFVLPTTRSSQEGFGLVPLEAMACKKSVVVTEIPAVSQDVKKYNAGLVVPSQNSKALALGIEKLLFDRALRDELAENAFNLVKTNYNWNRHVDTVEAEYFLV